MARCKFTQYMGYKANKFSIKFWLAADVDSKYMENGSPYLGKEETWSAGQLMGESVVLRLMDPILGKGRNITTEKQFHVPKTGHCLTCKDDQPGWHHGQTKVCLRMNTGLLWVTLSLGVN